MSVVQFPDGTEFDGDGSTPGTLLRGGHRQNLIPMLSKTVGVAAQVVADKLASAGSASAAAASAENAAGYAQTALEKAAQTVFDRIATGEDRVATGQDRTAVAGMLESLEGGPLLSVNGKPGPNPVLGPVDIAPAATSAEMAAGTETDYRSMSPALVAGAVAALAKIVRVPRAANTALAVADNGRLIDITSGTFTQTFAAASVLGSGWFCWLRNSGSGVITLDPSGSETVDGAATLDLYPGQARLVQCDGAALRTVPVSGAAVMTVVDEKPSGTSGGSSAAGAFATRALNTIRANTIPGASLSANVVTLPAGIYRVYGSAPAFGVGGHKARLFNTLAGSLVFLGTSEQSSGTSVSSRSVISGQFSVSASASFRIDHWAAFASSASDFGPPTGIAGLAEVYTEINFIKVG